MCPPVRETTTIRHTDNKCHVWVARHKQVFSRTSPAASAQALAVSTASEPTRLAPRTHRAWRRSRLKTISQSAKNLSMIAQHQTVGGLDANLLIEP